MAKKQVRFGWEYDVETMSVTVLDKVTEESMTFYWEDLPEAVQAQISLYGIGKIHQDRSSQLAADDKFEFFSSLWVQLKAGQWKSERTGFGGPRQTPVEVLLIMQLKSIEVGPAEKAWNAQDKTWKAAFRVKYAEQIAELKAERATEDEVESLDDLI